MSLCKAKGNLTENESMPVNAERKWDKNTWTKARKAKVRRKNTKNGQEKKRRSKNEFDTKWSNAKQMWEKKTETQNQKWMFRKKKRERKSKKYSGIRIADEKSAKTQSAHASRIFLVVYVFFISRKLNAVLTHKAVSGLWHQFPQFCCFHFFLPFIESIDCHLNLFDFRCSFRRTKRFPARKKKWSEHKVNKSNICRAHGKRAKNTMARVSSGEMGQIRESDSFIVAWCMCEHLKKKRAILIKWLQTRNMYVNI